MIRKIIDFFFPHAKCSICKQIDHKQNMTKKWWSYRAFYHYKCREKAFNERLCECGKNWVRKKLSSNKKVV